MAWSTGAQPIIFCFRLPVVLFGSQRIYFIFPKTPIVGLFVSIISALNVKHKSAQNEAAVKLAHNLCCEQKIRNK